MKSFTALYAELDQSTATNDKVAAMIRYFQVAPAGDAAWAVWFLSGRRLKRLVQRKRLRAWAVELSGYPEWMLDETYQTVGDLAETLALILPEPPPGAAPAADTELGLRDWVEQRLLPLGELDGAAQGERIKGWWRSMTAAERFVLNKLMTGALRVGVSQRLVIRALASHLQIDAALVAQRMMGDWTPGERFFQQLEQGSDDPQTLAAMPYPFFLAAPLQAQPAELGAVAEWLAEWKWDGIRAQLIRRRGTTVIWSRGEERLDGRFPEIEAAALELPDGTVLDGELLASTPEGRFDFSALQRRIGRLRPGPKLLQDVPVVFLAFDCLEQHGADLRPQPLDERRHALAELLATAPEEGRLRVSAALVAESWTELGRQRDSSRQRGVEGLVLKRRSSPYRSGRRRGDWWKWKIDPLSIDAVLLYGQPGSGRRSNLLTDYTFGVRDGSAFVPVCKAYSGLTNEEITRLDRWIRNHTLERFGPVRAVPAEHVFEIAFEGIQASKRHKSGVALRFPRIARWRTDKTAEQCDSLVELRGLLEALKP